MIEYKTNEDILEEMLTTYVQLGKSSEARVYLDSVKSTFSHYDKWDKILSVGEKGLEKEVQE